MLYFNGDSWSTSYHVNDGNAVWPVNQSAWPRWPNLVAQDLGKEFLNESLGGSSNQRILDCVENLWLTGQRPEMIILALTGHSRISVPSGFGGYWNLNPGGALDSVTGKFDDQIHKWYYLNGHEDLDSVYRYYKIVWNLNRLCKQFGCPYLIVQAWDDHLVEQNVLDNIEDYVVQYFEEYGIHDVRADAYIKGFKTMRQDKPNWHYSNATFSKLIGKEHLDETEHPTPQGHKLIAKSVLAQIKGQLQ